MITCKSERELVRNHVLSCRECILGAHGQVWYCRLAREIIQRVRKARFFGGAA